MVGPSLTFRLRIVSSSLAGYVCFGREGSEGADDDDGLVQNTAERSQELRLRHGLDLIG